MKKRVGMVGERKEEKGLLDPATKVLGPVDPNWMTSIASRRAAKKV